MTIKPLLLIALVACLGGCRPKPPGLVAYTGQAIPAGALIYISSGTASCAVGPGCNPKNSVCVVQTDGKGKCEPQ